METKGVTKIELQTMTAICQMAGTLDEISKTLKNQQKTNDVPEQFKTMFQAFVKEFYVQTEKDDACMNALVKAGCDEAMAKELGVDWAFSIGREFNETEKKKVNMPDFPVKLKQAEPGDIVACGGVRAKIEKIISQYTDPVYSEDGTLIKEYLSVEFTDDTGRYRYWKQRTDGGRLIRKAKKEAD